MYVVSLIGRYADEGKAFPMENSAAESAIQFGTHRRATEAEMLSAGFVFDGVPTEGNPDELPAGFEIEMNNGGYVLYHLPDGANKVDIGFYKNMAAARSAATAYKPEPAAEASTAPVETPPSEPASETPAESEAPRARRQK